MTRANPNRKKRWQIKSKPKRARRNVVRPHSLLSSSITRDVVAGAIEGYLRWHTKKLKDQMERDLDESES